MKKQFQKFKSAAETTFSRSNKFDNRNSDDSLQKAESQVDKYKDVLEKITKKLPNSTSSSSDDDHKEKRCKKINEYRISLAMEESMKDLQHGPLRDILEDCSKFEKEIALEIISNEIDVESNVTKTLTSILDNQITTIMKQRKVVNKLVQDCESAKHKYQNALKINDTVKINQFKEEQEDIENKLEKERDTLAAETFDLIVQEENIAHHIVHYMKFQRAFYKNALDKVEKVMDQVNKNLNRYNWRVFKINLEDHLKNTGRRISYIIELCCCYLLERGLQEEGLLRLGCAGTKLKRLKSAVDAKTFTDVLPIEYQDIHLIASLLKCYLRDLPEPLLTFDLYNEFINASSQQHEKERKTYILNTINKLPQTYYNNLRYLTKFLSILSQNSQVNKMSSQNIAIVMSPNLLWPRNQNETDYAEKVTITNSVNTIVELLVSDWEFFFDGEVEFYESLTKEKLFQEINGERELMNHEKNNDIMSKSYHSSTPSYSYSTVNNSVEMNMKNMSKSSHSRSNSHDTSLILLSENKRSQSNSSLSDQSSPNQGSPKPTIRRKHNKQAAPTPPDHHQHNRDQLININKHNTNALLNKNKCDEKFDDSSNKTPPDRPPQPQPQKLSGSIENLNKPDKPPRPVVQETQTLTRNYHRPNAKPKAMPRTTLISREKLEFIDQNVENEEPIILRDKPPTNGDKINFLEKPAIPERPASLVRPTGLRSLNNDLNASLLETTNLLNSEKNASAELRKTQSFRSSLAVKPTPLSSNTNGNSLNNNNNNNSNNVSNNNSNNNSNGPTTLERTHIYNVDKQQVEFIDVIDSSNKFQKENLPTTVQLINQQSNEEVVEKPDLTLENTEDLIIETNNEFSLTQVPKSPRGFDPKVKRPQVPAPPPPTNRPKSTEDQINLTIETVMTHYKRLNRK